jgi:SIR2-like domain
MLSKLSEDQINLFAASIRNGEYNVLLGAGASLDAFNHKGEKLLSGNDLRVVLCNATGAKADTSLQLVYSILSPDAVEREVTDRFRSCTPGATSLELTHFLWRRIFTLNIDDALVAAYRRPGTLQRANLLTYEDDYIEARDQSEVQIVHLHGSVARPGNRYVFSRNDYVGHMKANNAWMLNLTQFLPVEPFIIAGTRLDEVDLDYYLSFRTPASQRSDRGPSFFVEPNPDAITEAVCKRHGLNLYVGTLIQFLSEVLEIVPNRPTALGLVPPSIRTLFPEDFNPKDLLAFSADFELVPNAAKGEPGASRFFFGHPPAWSDLAANSDVGRKVTPRISERLTEMLETPLGGDKTLVLLDETGDGKTTVLKRVAFQFAQRGVRVLMCSALSRLAPDVTVRCLNAIDGPVLVVVDDLADQVAPVMEISATIQKTDVAFFGAERSYRKRYLSQVLSSVRYEIVSGLGLDEVEAEQLVRLYTDKALYLNRGNERQIARSLIPEPIAVACCRILNNFRPLEPIVRSIIAEANEISRGRYYAAALSQFCFKGGIRYEVLRSAFDNTGLDEQLTREHPLPLAFVDETNRAFVTPLNAAIGARVLERLQRAERLAVFVNVANAIASRVNRKTIQARTAEAKLAARLFDYDQVVHRFLGEGALEFYEQVKDAWRWNVRYWEQVALYYLAQFRSSSSRDEHLLNLAVHHARFAVSIDRHSLALTTLGNILLARAALIGADGHESFSEAFTLLEEAIEIERRRWSRISIHPYATLFRGTVDFLRVGGRLSRTQLDKLRSAAREATARFGGDSDIRQSISTLGLIL